MAEIAGAPGVSQAQFDAYQVAQTLTTDAIVASMPVAASSTPPAVSVSGSLGVDSTLFARADHTHASPSVVPFAVAAPVARTLSLATAYQASTSTKPALLTVIVDTVIALALSPAANTMELIIGPANTVASGTGTLADSTRTDISVTVISIGLTSRQKLQAMLPVGYWFALRRTVGTGTSIASAFDQVMG